MWRYGYLYRIAKTVLSLLNKINLVEFFKFIFGKLNKDKKNEERQKTFERIGIDVFITLKWIFVFVLWLSKSHSGVTTFIVWYLIIANVFSYFYNHIWTDIALNTENFTKDRIRSRFLNLLLAVAYSIICFAYLYQIVYPNNFAWPDKSPNWIYALQFSFSNSLAANYNQVYPSTNTGNELASIQLFFTFFFIAIILSRSIPQTNSKV